MAETPDKAGPTVLGTASATIATASAVAVISQTNVTTTNGSNRITGVTADDRWVPGLNLEGSANIPAGAKLIGKNTAGTELYLDVNATGTASTVTISGYRWTLIRKMVLTNVTNNPVNVTVGIGTSNADTAAKRILPAVTVQPGQPLIEDGMGVIEGGATPDLIYAFCDLASGANIYLALVAGP